MTCPVTFYYDGPMPPLAVWEEYRRRARHARRVANPSLPLADAERGWPVVPADRPITDARQPARPAPVAKKAAGPGNAAPGSAVLFPDRKPWAEPVFGAELLGDLSQTVRRFVVLPAYAADAAALWVLFTYCIHAVSVAPILAVSSPEKRCGKSTLLSLLVRLAFRPLQSSNITPSAVFRSIEAWSPTLIIDEADTFLRTSEEMRGVLNSGHSRDSAFVIRNVGLGDNYEPRRFSTWGAKAIALIGKLPDTLHDRAILIELRRKLRNDATEKLRRAQPGLFDDLARKCARFALDNAKAVAACRPAIPEPLHDRAADNWEPLLAIAEVAGGDWPERARAAALALSGEDAAPASRGVELLADIRNIFAERGTDRIASATLIEALTGLDERPWADFRDGEPITPKNVAELLSPFGMRSKSIRIEDETPKGYLREQFEDAFERYLPPFPVKAQGPQPPHRHNPISTGDSGHSAAATERDMLRMEDARKGPPNKACCGVAATSGAPKEVAGPVAIPVASDAPNRPGERSASTSKEPCA